MAPTNNYVCDECDKPATSWVRDMFDVTDVADIVTKYAASKVVRYGCGDHPVESNTIYARTNTYKGGY